VTVAKYEFCGMSCFVVHDDLKALRSGKASGIKGDEGQSNTTLVMFFFSNGRYIDYLSLTYATNKNGILKVTL